MPSLAKYLVQVAGTVNYAGDSDFAGPDSIKNEIVSEWEASEARADLVAFAASLGIIGQHSELTQQSGMKRDGCVEIDVRDKGQHFIDVRLGHSGDEELTHFAVFSSSGALLSQP